MSFIYELIVNIKNTANNPVILYECCLILKQLSYDKLEPSVLCRAVNDFSEIIFSLVSEVQNSQKIWHLITLISNLIESAENNESFIIALGNIGLRKLLIDDNEMIMASVAEMLEKLILKYQGNKIVNEAVCLHLSSRLKRKDKQAFTL